MTDRTRLEAMFVEHLATIERVVQVCCRRHGINPSDCDEVLSWIRLKFVECDYAPLARFRGESSITTYITVVVASYVRDWRIQHCGRWRPSSAARTKGDLAVRLERLVHRDGHALKEAGERLRTSGETKLTDKALADLLATLPTREPMRPVSVDESALATVEANTSAEASVNAADDAASRESVNAALDHAVASLAAEERLMIRMKFWEGASVADIARALGLLQKPLYRRLERALQLLRERLEARGVSPQLAQRVVEEQLL